MKTINTIMVMINMMIIVIMMISSNIQTRFQMMFDESERKFVRTPKSVVIGCGLEIFLEVNKRGEGIMGWSIGINGRQRGGWKFFIDFSI